LRNLIEDPEIGWAAPLLYNERTKRLIDGHARKRVVGADDYVPVLIGSWSEEAEKKILATLDPLAGMAEADPAALQALLAEVDLKAPDLEALAMDLADLLGQFEADEVGAPQMAGGDRAPFQQMTFTLHDDQAAMIVEALAKAKKAGPFGDTSNENSNGNALARVAEAYLGAG